MVLYNHHFFFKFYKCMKFLQNFNERLIQDELEIDLKFWKIMYKTLGSNDNDLELIQSSEGFP